MGFGKFFNICVAYDTKILKIWWKDICNFNTRDCDIKEVEK